MNKLSQYLASLLLAITLLPVVGCSSPPIDTEQMLSDQDVSNKVKTAIYSDPMTKESEIHVTTEKGIVHLKGAVRSQAALDRAVELARNASGAFGVKAELSIK